MDCNKSLIRTQSSDIRSDLERVSADQGRVWGDLGRPGSGPGYESRGKCGARARVRAIWQKSAADR